MSTSYVHTASMVTTAQMHCKQNSMHFLARVQYSANTIMGHEGNLWSPLALVLHLLIIQQHSMHIIWETQKLTMTLQLKSDQSRLAKSQVCPERQKDWVNYVRGMTTGTEDYTHEQQRSHASHSSEEAGILCMCLLHDESS